MNYAKVFSLLTIFSFYVTLTFAQNKNLKDSSVSKVGYTQSGGEIGWTESIEISADSMIYYLNAFEKEKRIVKKTRQKLWRRITNSIDLAEFDRIQSNPTMLDAPDIEIIIETGIKKRSLVNGDSHEIEKGIGKFVKLLKRQLKKFRWMSADSNG